MLKKEDDQFVGFLVGRMFGTVAHAHPVFITQKLVHCDGMVEGNPAFYRILRAAGTLLPAEVRSLDAIHLATVVHLRGDIASLVTYDERMTAAARDAGRVAILGYNYIQNPVLRQIEKLVGDGAIGTIETAWTATGWEEGFWVHGTEGSLESTNRHAQGTLRHRFRASVGASWDQTDVAEYSFAGAGSHVRHVMAFVQAVRGEGPVVCSGADGREAVRLILAAYASAQSGSPVRTAEVGQ